MKNWKMVMFAVALSGSLTACIKKDAGKAVKQAPSSATEVEEAAPVETPEPSSMRSEAPTTPEGSDTYDKNSLEGSDEDYDSFEHSSNDAD